MSSQDAATTDGQGDGHRLGATLRAARRRKSLSAREVARRIGVSGSLISQIELGRTSPSMGTLRQLSDVLDVPMAEFFGEAHPADPAVPAMPGKYGSVVRADHRKALYRPDSPVRFELLTADLTGPVEFMRVELQPGNRCHDLMAHPVGEEILFVVAGALRVRLADEVYRLATGDSLQFSCSTPHSIENPGPEMSVHVAVLTAIGNR